MVASDQDVIILIPT